MDHQKVLSLLNEADDSKFVTRKWNIVNNQSNGNYNVKNKIVYNTEVLKSNLCGYNDAYILVRDAAVQVAFKNYAPFIKCTTNVDGTSIDDAEDLDLVMTMYNLLVYSLDYSDTKSSLWFYSKDEATNFNADIAYDNTVNNFKSFDYRANLLPNTVAQPTPNNINGILNDATFAVPLKCLSNFWQSLEVPLINSKVELKFKWAKHKTLCFSCGS